MKSKYNSKLLHLFLGLVLIFLFPSLAFAASQPALLIFDISEGNINIEQDISSTLKVSYGTSSAIRDNISQTDIVTLTSITKNNTVKAINNSDATLLLDDLNIDLRTTDNTCAMDLSGTSKTTIILKDNIKNILQSESNNAGIQAPNSTTLIIKAQTNATEKLEATGGTYAAGIGGSSNGDERIVNATERIVKTSQYT